MAQRFVLDEFLKYKSILLKGREEDQWEIINKLRKASSLEDSPPLNLIVQADLVPILMVYHKNHDISEAVLHDILWTLSNIGSGNASETLYIVQQGGVEYFMEFLGHFSEVIYGQALWGLANIAGESAKFRDLLLAKGALTKTMELYYKRKGTMKVETRRTIAWLLNNFCRNKPPVEFPKVEECLPYLVDSLKDADHDVVVENLWACAYITEISEDAIRALMNKNLTEQIVAHLATNIERLTIVTPALKTCSNIVTGSDEVTEKLLSYKVVPIVIALIGSQKLAIRREACYFFSNVAAGLPAHINALFEHPAFLPSIINIIKTDDATVVNEAIWIVANSLMGNTLAHAKKIVNSEVFVHVFQRMGTMSKRTQLMAVEGFKELLNHVMDMNDTPLGIIAQIKFYKDNIEKNLVRLQDANFSKTLIEVDNLISDVLDCVSYEDLLKGTPRSMVA